MRIEWEANHATREQIQYIEILAIDLEMHRLVRNAHIRELILRRFEFLDELTMNEASRTIDKFKEWKENKKNVIH